MYGESYEERECIRCYGDGCPSCEYAGTAMVFVYAEVRRELHHRIPQCLLTMRDNAEAHANLDGEGIQWWMEYEWECYYVGIDPDIPRDDLAGMIERSAYWMSYEDHRNHHRQDFRRWGSRGGRETYRRYGRGYFRMLSLCRWKKATRDDLASFREAVIAD